jgi:hypothetical protein
LQHETTRAAPRNKKRSQRGSVDLMSVHAGAPPE